MSSGGVVVMMVIVIVMVMIIMVGEMMAEAGRVEEMEEGDKRIDVGGEDTAVVPRQMGTTAITTEEAGRVYQCMAE